MCSVVYTLYFFNARVCRAETRARVRVRDQVARQRAIWSWLVALVVCDVRTRFFGGPRHTLCHTRAMPVDAGYYYWPWRGLLLLPMSLRPPIRPRTRSRQICARACMRMFCLHTEQEKTRTRSQIITYLKKLSQLCLCVCAVVMMMVTSLSGFAVAACCASMRLTLVLCWWLAGWRLGGWMFCIESYYTFLYNLQTGIPDTLEIKGCTV